MGSGGSGICLRRGPCVLSTEADLRLTLASRTQGTADNFYKNGQLLPENFLKAARDTGYDEVQVRVRSQDGYDHSYYFVRCAIALVLRNPLIFMAVR